MKTRNEFPTLLKSMGLTDRAAEIGVAEGYFSHHLLDHWPGMCWQIDPWEILDTPGFSGHGEATNAEQEARFQRMLARAKDYHGRCIVKRATSEQAVKQFKDGFFDFVYIDAVHTREASAQDISLWRPKVRSGGVLAGHDYLNGVFHGQAYGVKASVDAFARTHGLAVNVTQETDWPSWWIVMP